MSVPLIPVADPFNVPDERMTPEQAAAKRLAEHISATDVMPFEREKDFVNRDHVRAQAKVWGLRDDHMRPIELDTPGRNA